MNSRQNVLNQKINKRVVKKMLEQASKYTLDVNPIEQDVDVKTTYNSLMKSLNFIYLILSQVVSGIDLKLTEEVENLNKRANEKVQKFNREAIQRELQRQEEQGYEGENPNDYEDDINSRFGRIGSQGSQYPFSLGSRSIAPSEYEEVEFEDDPNDPEVLYGYPEGSLYGYPEGSVYGYPQGSVDGSNISSLTGKTLELLKLGEVESAVSLNSLEKEVVNVKFYVEQLLGQFNLLTKVQKQKLATIVQKINKQINHIGRIYSKRTKKYTQLHNSFVFLKSSLKIINDELSLAGEGIILEDGGQYGGSGRVNKGIYNIHQPTKYVNPSNVNMNWAYNLAQRNN
jgi:hypothetical protein